MRTLALLAAAAAADDYVYDYTLYPLCRAKGIRCSIRSPDHVVEDVEGRYSSLNGHKINIKSSCAVRKGCAVPKGVSLILVKSLTESIASKDAFTFEGVVDTTQWETNRRLLDFRNNSKTYDVKGLTLGGGCHGRSYLTVFDTYCTAKCDDARYVPVTLVKFFVRGRFIKHVVANCDGDKKSLLQPLDDDEPVKEFLKTIG